MGLKNIKTNPLYKALVLTWGDNGQSSLEEQSGIYSRAFLQQLEYWSYAVKERTPYSGRISALVDRWWKKLSRYNEQEHVQEHISNMAHVLEVLLKKNKMSESQQLMHTCIQRLDRVKMQKLLMELLERCVYSSSMPGGSVEWVMSCCESVLEDAQANKVIETIGSRVQAKKVYTMFNEQVYKSLVQYCERINERAQLDLSVAALQQQPVEQGQVKQGGVRVKRL